MAPLVVAPLLMGSGTAFAASHPSVVSETAWQHEISQLPQLGVGCYQAHYPSLTWEATACHAGPAIPLAPAAQPRSAAPSRPATVGDGTDYSAVVTGKISKAVGTFTHVTEGITEMGPIGATGKSTPNAFSLQLNTQFFSGSPTCSGGASGCLAWQQFAYDTDGNSVFMQYWLIGYTNSCPKGWTSYSGDCYKNSPTVTLGSGKLTAADLATVQLTATATAGGNDEDAVVNGSGTASMTVNKDTVVDVAKFWNTTEWGVFGSGGGNQANFPKKSTLEPQTVLTATGTLSCVEEGFTGETNNLSLTSTPSLGTTSSPTMASKQTNNGAKNASCATAQG
jgi:hypothetical protein